MVTSVGTGSGASDSGTEAAQAAVEEASTALDGRDPDFAAVFSSPTYEYENVIQAVREATDGATLVGSSSAGEFTERGAVTQSVTVSLVASDDMQFHVGLGEGLEADAAGAVEAAAAKLPERDESYPYSFGINLHDGLVGRGEEVAMLGYQQYQMPYAGGSAADDRALEETVVFANDTAASDAVAIAMLESKRPFGRAVDHGHEPVAGTFEATATDGSVVETLDGQPAYEVWKDAVRERVRDEYDIEIDDLSPDDDRFSALLTRFEFGIKSTDGDYKVRWPGLTPDLSGSLDFATTIAEGTELYVMDSGPEAQLELAESVSRDALASQSDTSFAGGLAFDCICQGALLGDEFDDAVGRMAAALDVPFAGFQTYGEVSMSEGDMRAYHNSTSSLVLIPE